MADIIIHRDLTGTRYAIVSNGVVIGVTLLDIQSNPTWTPPTGKAIPCDDTIAIGDTFDGKTFTKQITAPVTPEPTVDTLTNILLKKGVITSQDITDAQGAVAVGTIVKPPTV